MGIIAKIITNIYYIGWFGVNNPITSSLEGEDGSGIKVITKVTDFLTTAVYASAVVAIIFIIWGGISYATANGEADKIKKATGTIINSVIGLIIILLSRLIIYFVVQKIME